MQRTINEHHYGESTIQGTVKGTEKTSNGNYCLQKLLCLKGWNKTHITKIILVKHKRNKKLSSHFWESLEMK